MQTDINYQETLIKTISNLTFNLGEFDCVIVVSKNPQLLSLLCCLEVKKTISSPYPSGTNFYYPIETGKAFRRITVNSYQTENGVSNYWYEEVKGTAFSVCRTRRSAVEFEKNAVLAKDQDSTNWIRQRDVSSNKLSKHSGQKYPELVSTRRNFEYWLNIDIGNNKTLLSNFGFENSEEFNKSVNFHSHRTAKLSKESNFIWINSIPDTLDNKRHIIILSPNSSRFDEFNSDINELYHQTENIKVWMVDELSDNFQLLVKKCSKTNPLSMWSKK